MSWASTTVDFQTVDAEGNPLTLAAVPAQSCVECNRTRISPDDVLRAEQIQASSSLGVTPIEGNVLLYVYADMPAFAEQSAEIREKYRLNKMLFYQWAELDKIGLGHARIHDSFYNDVRGPVPEHLDETCKSLESKGLLDVEWGGKAAKRPYVYRLTPRGKAVSAKLWKLTPDLVRDAVSRTKFSLFTLDRFQIRDKVHAEYPQFRKTFTRAEADA